MILIDSIEIAIDLPQGKRGRSEYWTRDFAAFVTSQTRKNHIEISERRLTEKEREEIKGAKNKEVKNYILAEVFKKLADDVKPDAKQILKMRWILTWKFNQKTVQRSLRLEQSSLGIRIRNMRIELQAVQQCGKGTFQEHSYKEESTMDICLLNP